MLHRLGRKLMDFRWEFMAEWDNIDFVLVLCCPSLFICCLILCDATRSFWFFGLGYFCQIPGFWRLWVLAERDRAAYRRRDRK